MESERALAMSRAFTRRIIFLLALSGMLSVFVAKFVSELALADSRQEISLRLDIRNVTGPEGQGELEAEMLLDHIGEVNGMWNRCGIRFLPRSYGNLSSTVLRISYEPRSASELSTIHQAVHPQGMGDALPLTVAGPWKFFDGHSQKFLAGLGWAFVRPDGRLDRAGAMVAAQWMDGPRAGQLISHELGHALSLDHSPQAENVMAGGYELTDAQCEQARLFATTYLQAQMEKPAATTLARISTLPGNAAH